MFIGRQCDASIVRMDINKMYDIMYQTVWEKQYVRVHSITTKVICSCLSWTP